MSDNIKRSIRTTAVAGFGAAVIAQAALAGGEAKNQAPFTRPVTAHVTHAVLLRATSRASDPVIRGEAKNQRPFTNRA
jgi:hypothetical protein